MFRRIERSVSILAEHVSMVLIVVMTLVVCFTVLTRYGFSYTPSWGEETALLCMVWFGFLSTALGVRDDGHIGVTVLDSMLPKKTLRWLDLFKWAAVFAYGLFMLSEGWGLVKIGMRNNFPGLGISSAWLYSVVPIAGAAIMVYCCEKIVDIFRGKAEPAGDDKGAC